MHTLLENIHKEWRHRYPDTLQASWQHRLSNILQSAWQRTFPNILHPACQPMILAIDRSTNIPKILRAAYCTILVFCLTMVWTCRAGSATAYTFGEVAPGLPKSMSQKAAPWEVSVPPRWSDKIREAWVGLSHSKTYCADFDYFPDGGFRNFYCHLLEFSSYPEMEEFFGEPIFLQGPHRKGFLILDDPYSFGHYNPHFPIFLRKVMVPGSTDSEFRKLTQWIYERYIQNLARIAYATHQKLHSNPVYLSRERARYNRLIAERRLEPYYYEKFYSFLHPNFTDDENPHTSNSFEAVTEDGEYDGNVAKTCVAFWIRRSIDGTEAEFFQGLKLLLIAYDADFLKRR